MGVYPTQRAILRKWVQYVPIVLFAQEDACSASTEVISSSFHIRLHAAHTRRQTKSSPSRKSDGPRTTKAPRDSGETGRMGQLPHQSKPGHS